MSLLKQVVDLSDNVLTTILPMMIIALKLPRLEVDLADNPWQCDYSVAAFQNVISESWRKTWNVICSKSVGKSVVPLLSETVPAELKKHMKNLVSFETVTVPVKARVLIMALSQPRAVSRSNHWRLTASLSSRMIFFTRSKKPSSNSSGSNLI